MTMETRNKHEPAPALTRTTDTFVDALSRYRMADGKAGGKADEMMVFKVWDEFNNEESRAAEISAESAEDAAESYAVSDIDGNIDGLYLSSNGGSISSLTREGQPISVRDSSGKMWRFRVGIIDFEPVWGVEERMRDE